MSRSLVLAIPSKGRLMEACEALFARAGFKLARSGAARGYRGEIAGLSGVEVAFLSAGEIAAALRSGRTDLGVTGEDLLRETIPAGGGSVEVMLRLGFGPADVVVAVPESWLDVATMADLEEVSHDFYARHGHRLRVATKYVNLTRRFFAEKGVAGYRIVESLGATEGAPASGTAEVIIDITTTGSTLKANGLKVLDDGLILRSEAVLAGRAEIARAAGIKELIERLEQVL
jgi:ATP phosphoribosyltransferase